MGYARALMPSNLAPTLLNVFDRRGLITMQKYQRRLSRMAFRFLEVGLAVVFLGAVVHHIFTLEFKPLAALCLPILVVYFGFASLLYIRGRSLTEQKAQIRSLYAAERAMQAAIWHLFGIILGASVYGLLRYFGITFHPSAPPPAGLWLLVFLAPYALMQIGLLCFMRAARAVSPAFFRRVGVFELRRRVQQ